MGKTELDLHLTPELLGLDNIQIDSVQLADDGSIHVKVSSTESEILCRKCKRPTDAHGKGRRLKLRHLSLFGRNTYIEITPPRGICKNCDDTPTTTQTLSWFDRNGHHTKPYNDYLLL